MKKVLLVFFALFSISFCEIKDDLDIFNATEEKTLGEQIDILQKKHGIKIIVVTSEYGDSYILENPEKTLIMNIQKSGENIVKIEENFTNDMNMQEKDNDISLLIDNLEPFLLKKEYVKYLVEFASSSLEMYEATEKENLEMEKKEFYVEHKWALIKWSAIVLTLLNIIGRICYISKKKKQRMLEAIEDNKIKKIEKLEKNRLFHDMKK